MLMFHVDAAVHSTKDSFEMSFVGCVHTCTFAQSIFFLCVSVCFFLPVVIFLV